MRTALRTTRKGGGPRSAAGKKVASRNALRHGFSAATYRRSPAPERLERLAQAIMGEDCDPAIVAQAFRIAENEIILSEIAAHKVWMERNKYEALEAAVLDLQRLDRYEQRAWARQKGAIRQLTNIKFNRRLA